LDRLTKGPALMIASLSAHGKKEGRKEGRKEGEAAIRNDAEAQGLHLASTKGSASVIALLMPGGHPARVESCKNKIKDGSKSLQKQAAIHTQGEVKQNS
jgi:hypothetical protein